MNERLDVRDFGDQHLTDAAVLLAARHVLQRQVEPLLSPAFEEPEAAGAVLETAWSAESASGAAAVNGGRLVGFMVGAPKPGSSWGPNVWVESAGHAARDGEIVRDLYAHAARGWVEAGWTKHYAVVPTTDPALLEAWYRLGFGQQQGLGIREVPKAAGEPGPVRVRTATEDDVDVLVELDLLGEYQATSPTFAPHTAPDPAEVRAELVEEIADPAAEYLIAELDGRAVGCATVAPVAYSGLHTGVARPDNACILGYAATLPEVRGAGAGVALTEGVFSWARERGYTTVVVDWRVPNLLSSRFWPARGFRTSFIRLHRSIA